jgi:hypothetical protein
MWWEQYRSDNCANQLFDEDEVPSTHSPMVEHSGEFNSFISRATEAKEHTPWIPTRERVTGKWWYRDVSERKHKERKGRYLLSSGATR